MQTPKEILREIAQELDCGFDCYFNPKTNEIVTIPTFSQEFDENEIKENFGAELEKVEKHKADFIKIEVLRSNQSFEIMEKFAAQVPDQRLQFKLQDSLRNRSPFRNFKYLVDNSEFREDWFEFKQNETEKIVEGILKF